MSVWGNRIWPRRAERTADRASVVVTDKIADVPRGDGWFETRHFACVTLHAPLPLAVDVVTGEMLDAAQCPRP